MDIGIKTSNGDFSLRAAGLVIKGNKLLAAKNDSFDCYYTVGGGVWENESTQNAVIRELHEETGYTFETDRLVCIQERFYTLNSTCHHEVVFFYLMKNSDFDIKNGKKTDQQTEHLYWLNINELDSINLVPAFLKNALKNIPNEIVHVVSYE